MAENLEAIAKFIGNFLMTNTNLDVEKICDVEEHILTFKPEEKPEVPLEEWEAAFEKRVAGIKKDMELGRYRGGHVNEKISHLNPPKAEPHCSESFVDTMRRMLEHHVHIPSEYGSTRSGRYLRHKPAFHELYGSRTPMVIMDDLEKTEKLVLDSISSKFIDMKTLSPRRSSMVYFDEAHHIKRIEDMWPYYHPKKVVYDEPDNRDKPDWKRDTFKSGPATPPSDAKRVLLRSKRKKRSK